MARRQPPPAQLGLADAAMRLSLSYTQALRLLHIGQLDGGKVNGRYQVTAVSVERVLRDREATNPPTASVASA